MVANVVSLEMEYLQSKTCFGITTRVNLKLKDKLITTTRVMNSETKQMRLKTFFEQTVCGNPSRNTKGPIPKFIKSARDRSMLREIRIASKQVTGSANHRKAKGVQRGVASIYFGASACRFTCVQRLFEFKESSDVLHPKIR